MGFRFCLGESQAEGRSELIVLGGTKANAEYESSVLTKKLPRAQTPAELPECPTACS